MILYDQLKFLILILAMFLPVVVLGAGPTLYRTPYLGMVGEDVRQLQQWLNANGFVVAASGPGAPGFETTYYGALTAAAYGRYQASLETIANLPVGCTATTIYSPLTGVRCDSSQPTSQTSQVTGATQIVLGSASGQNTTQPRAISASGGSLNLSSFSADLGGFALPPETPLSTTMRITAISPTSGPAGTRVTITGYGFDKTENIIHTGVSEENVASSDGAHLKLTIDPDFEFADELDIDLDLHFYVVNKTGSSNDIIFKLTR